MKDFENSASIDRALVHWLFEVAPFGVLVTDRDLKILYANSWFRRSAKEDARRIVGSGLYEAFPDLTQRGFDRYYREVLAGQTRILSHRFHKYLIPMEPNIDAGRLDKMPQSARISPLMSGDVVTGTISVIEDISDRVAREDELNFQIRERERLLESEISARELAEENERLRGTFETLINEGRDLKEKGRQRDRSMHRIIRSQEEERKRIARDLHDHLGQQLTALRFALTLLKQQIADGSDLAETVDKAHSIAHHLDFELDYISWELRPAELDDIGLRDALNTFIREWSTHYGIPADFHSFGLKEVRLPADVEINLYRIAQESLNNISKHAKARRASVFLEYRDSDVVLIVEDDGVGFDASEHKKPKTSDNGLGLFGMRERAALVGGSVEIASKRGTGTSVYARVKVSPSGNDGAGESRLQT